MGEYLPNVVSTRCPNIYEREWFPTSATEKESNNPLDMPGGCNLLPIIDDDSIPERRSHREEQGSPPGTDVAEVPWKFPSIVSYQRGGKT